jgi:two-component system LytT family response regulator
MIQIIYVDDSKLNQVKFEQEAESLQLEYELQLFSDALSALAHCEKHKVDIAFLDIEMPGQNGLWLAKELLALEIPFAFVTAHSTFAIAAFELYALHYIQKPVTTEAIQDVLQRLKSMQPETESTKGQLNDIDRYMQFKEYPKRIFVNTHKQIVVLQLHDVLYIEAEGSYTNFYMTDGSIVVSGKNLGKYTDLILLNPDFKKVHRKYIINQAQLVTVTKKRYNMTFNFSNDKKIVLSSFHRDGWFDAF